ncbi:MAG: hypothetical protein K0S06_447 [Microvirga sp.]|jgi:hypothetical protein|nr:hypothetical protein [Microvirga sp.]
MSSLARPAAVLAALLLAMGAAFAQQPAPSAGFSQSHLAVAREVAATSGITRSLDAIIPQLYDRIREQVVARPDIGKDINEVLKALDPEMELQKQRGVTIIAGIFAREMTEAELNDTLAFFRSPSGRRYVETQPLVLDDLVREMQRWSLDLAEYVMTRVRAEMAKRGHQLQ